MTITTETVIFGGVIQLSLLVVSFFLGEAKATIANKSALKKESKDEAIRAYRTLMGIRVPLVQIIVSRYEAYIFFAFHERRWILAGSPQDTLDFTEAQRWQYKSESGVDKITLALQTIFENCATLSIYFKNDDNIQSLIDDIYNFKTFVMPDFTNVSAQDLDTLRDQAVADVQKKTEEHYTKPVKKLLKAVNNSLF